jgi:fibronectin type 3 domain-containing protein
MKTRHCGTSVACAKVASRPRSVVAMLLLLSVIVSARGQVQDTTAVSLGTNIPRDPGFATIAVIARTYQDSVVLRWAPSTPHGWRIANRLGYIVERRQAGGQTTRLTPEPKVPWPIERLADALDANPNNSYLGLAVYALAGDTTLMGLADSLGIDTVGVNAEKNTTLYGYALFSADNDPLVAEALGLRYVDRNVKAGERYTYRVSLSEKRDYRIDPGEVTVEVKATGPSPAPANFTAQGLDGRIDLRWEGLAERDYSGYYVYRSDDGGKTFSKMNKTPIVIVAPEVMTVARVARFVDTTIANYKVYRYQVRGIDAFGELGSPGEVEAFGRDLTPPPRPTVKNPEQLGSTRIRLSWEMTESSPDLAGFAISRSAFIDSNYHDLTKKPLAPTVREYTDEQATEAEPYYIIAALDTAGNESRSFPIYGMLIDTIPPSVPTGLSGTIDRNGIVHLQWRRGSERNLLGYRVLRANAPNHEFSQLTGEVHTDTTFVDTVEVRTLTRNVYYRVASVNRRYIHSELSSILALRRPDVVPPEAPVFTDVFPTDSSVVLRWAPSTSEDLKWHILYRRLSGEQRWIPIDTLSRNDRSYADSAVQQNTLYEYLIEAVDSTGLNSPAVVPVQARSFDTGVRPPVENLTARYDEKEKRIALRWSYRPRKQESYFFIIYRAARGAPLTKYRSVESAGMSFTDADLVGSGVYRYAVQVVTENGSASRISDKVQVTIPGK